MQRVYNNCRMLCCCIVFGTNIGNLANKNEFLLISSRQCADSDEFSVRTGELHLAFLVHMLSCAVIVCGTGM